ncbi:MAG TPA: methylmalonyl-CoA epimerase [Ktedonobacterales bacterium]|jgi:methylmalonyl-CoA/ethylmalonyl-CoA epimerase|nr:methylmalonyl-CoA epimerase [Ktedonobacterales bacterium]
METHGLTQGVKRIDHVAIVVRELETALRFYRDTLGVAPSRVIDFPREGVKIAFLPLGGPNGSEIELLEPTDPTGGVARFLEKRGEGLHHLCLEVEDIDAALAELMATGATVLDTAPRPTAEGRGIFLHPKGTGGVLLELVQRAVSEPDAAGDSENGAPSV